MIPKIIHFCWLSNDPFPENIQRCIDSWHKLLPDYEFIHWNFDRFPRGKSQWVDEAFDNHKYAFAADYIRLYALYNYGGIYLDTDVEVLQSFSPFLKLNTFMCWQNGQAGLEVAAMGAEKGCLWLRDCLNYYTNRSFIRRDGKFDMRVLPVIVETELLQNGYSLPNASSIDEAESLATEGVIPVFPYDFFSPKSYKSGELHLTKNSVCIHHFSGSWLKPNKWVELEKRLWKSIGVKNLNIYNKVKWNVITPIMRIMGLD